MKLRTFIPTCTSTLLFTMAQMSSAATPSIHSKPYGQSKGKDVTAYTLTNANGMIAEVLDYGGVISRLTALDKNGKREDVVLGCKDIASYEKDSPHFGCITGRVCNRIAKGKFTLDGKEYTLAQNNGKNHLHGGNEGFGKKIWAAKPEVKDGVPTLTLSYTSADGEEGYPGELKCTVRYELLKDDSLKMSFEATTNKPTPVNLTNHSYFNLQGAASGKDILGHVMEMNCSSFTVVDSESIPTGEIRKVAGTALNFTKATKIGERIESKEEQMVFGGGYDHNWIVDGKPGQLRLAARVYEPSSGRVLEVLTTDNAVQFYTANFLGGTFAGKEGAVYQKRHAFCLEDQHNPDSVNQPSFPSTILRPGETFSKSTVYKFSVRK